MSHDPRGFAAGAAILGRVTAPALDSPLPEPPARVGSDAPGILADLGYTSADVERLIATGIVGPTEWLQRT